MKSASRLRSAGLAAAIAAALAIPALTAAGGAAMAGTASGTAPFQTRIDRVNAGSTAAAGPAAAAAASRHVVAWGLNDFGQLGDGTTTGSDTPVIVPILVRGPSLGHLVSLAADCSHTVALFSRGAVLGWGQGTDGQLGNGATVSSDTPVGVLLPAGAKIAAIGASCLDSLARTIKGHVLAWGNGSLGQLGDGSTSSSDTPARVDLPAGLRAAAIGAGPGAETLFAITHQA